MAIILDGPVTPDEGTIVVRNIPSPVDASALDAWVPDTYEQSLEFDFTILQRMGNTARFRAYDAPAHKNPRDQITINRVPLVPLSASKPVISEQEFARLYGLAYLNDPKAATAEVIYDDLAALALDVRRRAQQAKGALLSTGQQVINEGGLNGTVDFGVPGGNKLTAPTLFTNTATADIVTFLNNAKAAYIAANGFPPGKMMTSTNVLTLMQQNVNLQKMAVQTLNAGVLGGFQGLIPTNAVTAILGNYNLPNPTEYIVDARVSIDGTSTLLLPSNVIILGPPDNLPFAKMQWGPTVTASKLDASGELAQIGQVTPPGIPALVPNPGIPGLIGFVDRADEFPYKEQSIVDSVGFAGLTNPNLLMILTVA